MVTVILAACIYYVHRNPDPAGLRTHSFSLGFTIQGFCILFPPTACTMVTGDPGGP